MEDFFKGYGIHINGIVHLSPKESLELCNEGAVLIDVREDYLNRFKVFDVGTIVFCPESVIQEKYKDLPKDKPMILADSVGIKSKKALLILKDLGIKNIANMAGGLVEWERQSLPLIIDISERLTGSCMCMMRPRNKKKKNE